MLIAVTGELSVIVRPGLGEEPAWLEVPPELRGKRLLLVADNRTQRTVVAQFARMWGLNIVEAESIAAAEATLGSDATHCDLLIVDHALLGASAAPAVASLRARPAAGAPLLLLSAKHLRPGEVEALGARGFVVKPIRPVRLREALMLALAAPAAHRGDAPVVSHVTAGSRD